MEEIIHPTTSEKGYFLTVEESKLYKAFAEFYDTTCSSDGSVNDG